MDKYRCEVCGNEYDPAKGDPGRGAVPGTAFGELPDGWCCPVCGATPDCFSSEG